MDNPLFAALQENFGDGNAPPPDTTTIKGLLAFCKLWSAGEVQTSELDKPCLEMASRLREGAKTEYQILQSNPALAESLREPIERMAEGYEAIADVLEALPQLAANNATQDFSEEVQAFETEREAVLDSNESIFNLQNGSVRTCPRCGEADDSDICEPCNLIRLYPVSPDSSRTEETTENLLVPVYGEVYEAQLAVLSGKTQPAAMNQALDKLEKHLSEVQSGLQTASQNKQLQEEGESSELQTVEAHFASFFSSIEQSFSGVQRMRSVHESFQAADITRGWESIFDAAVDMQRRFSLLSIEDETSPEEENS